LNLFIKHRVLRGVVPASGFLFDSTLLSEYEIRNRIFIHWKTGASLFNLPFGKLMLLPDPKIISTEASPGLPLVKINQSFCSFVPLKPSVLPVVPDSSILLWRNGRLIVILTDLAVSYTAKSLQTVNAVPEDPADWFSVNAVNYIKTEFPEMPKETEKLKPVQDEIPTDIRKQFGQPPVDERMMEAIKMLKEKTRPGNLQNDKKKRAGWHLFSSAAGLMAQLLLLPIKFIFGGYTQKNIPKNKVTGLKYTENSANHFLKSLLSAVKNLFKEFIIESKLGRIIGRRQARFFHNMMSEFEHGDIIKALHKAIPLSKDIKNSLSSIKLGTPNERSSLNITMNNKTNGHSFALDNDLFKSLQNLYRNAFQGLVSKKMVKEAAFVLAELLQESEEAVSFLEKNGMMQDAAELAEGRKLASSLCVRSWFLAGNKERAVNTAILYECFADALLRIEKRNDDRKIAVELRELWASSKAGAGYYTAAAEIIKDLPEKRSVMRSYLERALGDEGGEKARSFSMLLKYFPYEEGIFSAARDFIENDAQNRTMLLEELLKIRAMEIDQPRITLLKYGARLCLRELTNDLPQTIIQIMTETGDLALKEDYQCCTRQYHPEKSGQSNVEECIIHHWDQGSYVLREAVALPGGRLLVALGESGAFLISKDGNVVQRFDEPADRIILAKSGNQAIFLAQRGHTYRISKLDLISRKCRYWCDAHITLFTEGYDGFLWTVACKDDLVMIDLRDNEFKYLWHTGSLQGRIAHISRSEKRMICLTDNIQEQNNTDESGHLSCELYSYELPGLLLRDKETIRIKSGLSDKFVLLKDGGVRLAWDVPDSNGGISGFMIKTLNLLTGNRYLTDEGSVFVPMEFHDVSTKGFSACDSHLVLWICTSGGIRINIVTINGVIEKKIYLEGAHICNINFQESSILFTDDQGRLLLYNKKRGVFDRNLRIK
jgi:hypothetical protein